VFHAVSPVKRSVKAQAYDKTLFGRLKLQPLRFLRFSTPENTQIMPSLNMLLSEFFK
jgi:hypothetical protein